MTNELQQEAFDRRLGHCVKVVRLKSGDLAVLDQYDIVKGVFDYREGDELVIAIHNILDNPTVRQPFTVRPNKAVQDVADQFLKELGL